jgi:transcriptional regulator GlxA family with amidase domain
MNTSRQLRQLFCTILIGNTPRDPVSLLERHFASLSDDIGHVLWRKFAITNPSEDQIRSYCLFDLENLLQQSGGKTLSDFHLPIATVDFDAITSNQTMGRLIVEEQSYDGASLKADWEDGYNIAIPEQKQILDRIASAIDDPTSFRHNTRVFFIDGPGGAGKTFVENLLLASTRSNHKIALAVASSGIASVLLTGGRTSHSRFKIPLQIDAESTCNISAQSDLARLVKMTTMIVWDEAPAQHRHCFEAVNRTLQDIRQSNEWFGGITTVFSGQLLVIYF